MNITRPLMRALLLLAALAWQPLAQAQAGSYSAKGADTCLECHDDESATYSAKALFKTPHAQPGNKRSPFGAGGLQCEACHGPGAAHAKNKKAASINTFKADSSMPLAERNATCMACHDGTSRTAWHAGAHERAGLACTDCHKVHQERDPVLVKAKESQVCASCHKQQRADFQKTSTHPLRQGRMACSDCHNPHGSGGPSMLAKPTINQTCTSCHAEKRGPLLWEHAPVAEDCSLCHSPHGSVRNALLTKSPPLLCQQCHSSAGHPAVAHTPNGLPGGSGPGAIYLVGNSCSSCHSQVHGSNHPSGAKLMR
ncbi:Multiheme cytochrome MtrA [Rubrivivax sp. A210]|uniref:DmsE family decaheme c-type cytochrome n=1 Tax=Rubrivivax sp. A210 TaxID=2772301 RepID=UPI00191AE73B|nr:DmsE family decaheme c-type cytochrome [Rubrivivax sp. A210]CAD5375038.1 Multiheme cytochrome MtrA [Rubrivivax sp. A210]